MNVRSETSASIEADQSELNQLLPGEENLPKNTLAADQKKSRWQKAVDYFGIASEASNIGIVIEIVGKWIPALASVGAGVLSSIAFFSDPLIYFFKSLIRVTRLVGGYLGVEFEEEKHGKHRFQAIADVASLAFFSVAIPFFLGVVITSPVGLTVAWALALTGLCVVGYFDYYHPAR